jgi:hypothetical protein
MHENGQRAEAALNHVGNFQSIISRPDTHPGERVIELPRSADESINCRRLCPGSRMDEKVNNVVIVGFQRIQKVIAGAQITELAFV